MGSHPDVRGMLAGCVRLCPRHAARMGPSVKRVLGGVLAACVLATGCAVPSVVTVPVPVREADSIPFCRVHDESPVTLTVTGPAGGHVTASGISVGWLETIAGEQGEEVAEDAGPYSGILYNVPGPGEVRVNDVVCR